MVKTVCVIGVGLIGGSLAYGLRKQNWCESIIGIDAHQHVIDEAKRLNVIDSGYTSIDECPVIPDVVVIAVPVLKIGKVFEQLTSWVSQCKAITDVSSTKQSVIEDFNRVFAEQSFSCFVPGHPIAGREQSGVNSAIDNLFANRKVILTPTQQTGEDSLKLVTDMWQQVGANVEQLNAQDHDQILAATSHLPHALAFSLVHCLSTQSHTEEIFRYAAGGFADFSRIASSDPVVWRDICLANREELLNALSLFDRSLKQLKNGLQSSDGKVLEKLFLDAKKARDKYTNF
ncbi:MAG: prephenate dehydrogenase/arogenate dehydrogenase family protein [Gammaproteobacteria bacterium]|nr:prephenate dehydrogenase/arogenate dehydrogenase family protein [Gammaproteobacteria bacterium]